MEEKNVIVEPLFNFDDYEGKEPKAPNTYVPRKKGVRFLCTEERAEFLLQRKAVVVLGMTKTEKPKKEEKKVEIKEEKKAEKKTSTKGRKKAEK